VEKKIKTIEPYSAGNFSTFWYRLVQKYLNKVLAERKMVEECEKSLM